MEPDEITIQHGHAGRVESPIVEKTSRLAVEGAMRELIAKKLLYQKITVDLSEIGPALLKAGVKATKERIEELQQEISKRPWRLETRHLGDDPMVAEIYRHANIGGQAIGTRLEEMNLHFYAPSVQLRCRVCNCATTFIAILGSSEQSLGYPFPRDTDRGTEQVYTVIYRCEGCRKVIHAALVRREDTRLHLCGFAPRREHAPSRAVPKGVEPILIDAVNAVAEGDLFAGFYHLRTMLEFYLKGRVKALLRRT